MPTLDEWNPEDRGIWREVVGGQTISLRHPTYPVQAAWTDGEPDSLRAILTQYLAKVAAKLDLPPLFDPDGTFAVPMAWLSLSDPSAEDDPIRRSHVVTRYADPAGREGRLDGTAVFLAVETLEPGNDETVLGSRLGIRVVAHIDETSEVRGPFNVRITGAARSAALGDGFGLRASVNAELLSYLLSAALRDDLRRDGRMGETFWIEGVRIREASVNATVAEIYANVPQRDDEPGSPAYAFTVSTSFNASNQLQAQSVERFPLVAHAVNVHLFGRDPASKAGTGGLNGARPNRSPGRLDPFREGVPLEGITLDGAGETDLADGLTLVRVTQSMLVDEMADEAQPKRIAPAAIADPRINAFAAASGYGGARARFDAGHTRSPFETIMAYGLRPSWYFRFASRPLLVRYRAGMIRGPGRDGKTVNAEVAFNPCSCHLIGPGSDWDPAARRPLQVRFALADVQRSGSRREPLGLAADPRWTWHECCHVLLAGRTGMLELPFAHSAGDALAAITSDPWSELASDHWLRGYTFPWVYLHRRHDRPVHEGWGWNGRYHRQSRFGSTADLCRRKGYDSEQILSTSLFRLYRALGGDTVDAEGEPDRPARQRAADYTVYLILRMIALLPPAPWGPPETPDQLVSALIHADEATAPVASGPLAGRVGGWAHKVVRWAFEAQGLYATTDPDEIVDGPGQPPPVDAFIDDRRPDAAGDHPRGGYVPVSLAWGSAANPPPWHARDDDLHVNYAGEVSVRVRNRGHLDANGVEVQVWWVDWPKSEAEPPLWDPVQWTSLGTSGPDTIPAGAVATFTGFAPLSQPPGTRRLILAAAGCPADRSNVDFTTGLPCALHPTPVVDLVAGDNNLGLVLREVD